MATNLANISYHIVVLNNHHGGKTTMFIFSDRHAYYNEI